MRPRGRSERQSRQRTEKPSTECARTQRRHDNAKRSMHAGTQNTRRNTQNRSRIENSEVVACGSICAKSVGRRRCVGCVRRGVVGGVGRGVGGRREEKVEPDEGQSGGQRKEEDFGRCCSVVGPNWLVCSPVPLFNDFMSHPSSEIQYPSSAPTTYITNDILIPNAQRHERMTIPGRCSTAKTCFLCPTLRLTPTSQTQITRDASVCLECEYPRRSHPMARRICVPSPLLSIWSRRSQTSADSTGTGSGEVNSTSHFADCLGQQGEQSKFAKRSCCPSLKWEPFKRGGKGNFGKRSRGG